MTDKIGIELTVDDKGSAVVKRFSDTAANKVKSMSTKSVGHLKKMTAAFGRAAGAAARIAKKVGMLATKMAALGVAAATAIAGFVFTKAVQGFATFESALVDMGKVTKEDLGAIKQKIMDLDPALGSATEMVKGYYQVISAGVTDPKKALETLTVAAMAAKAAHVDQSEVIKGLTKVMAGYEGKIKTVSEAADLLYTIEKEGQTSVAELIPVIGGLAKISHDLGVSQDELGGSLALISQTAGSTAEAATQYQGVLMGLMKPTKEMSEALLGMGFESAQAAIAQLGLAGTLRKLKEHTGGSAEKMNELFGRIEGIKGMSALAAGDFGLLNEKVDAMKNKTGAAEQAWKNYKGTLSAIWVTFKNTVGKQLIMIGEKLAPAIKKVVSAVGGWLEKNRELITQEVGAWIEKIVEFAGKLKPLFIEIVGKIGDWYQKNKDIMGQKLEEFLNNLIPIIKSLADNLNILITPIKWLIKAFQVMGIGLGEAAGKASIMIEKMSTLEKLNCFSSPLQFLINFRGAHSPKMPLSQAIADVKGWLKSLGEMASTTHKTIVNFGGDLLEGLNTAKSILVSFVKDKYEVIVNLGGTLLSGISAAWSKLKDMVSKVWKATVNFVGKGSAELPLTEKLKELSDKTKEFGQGVEAQKPKLTVDTSGAVAALKAVGVQASQISRMILNMSQKTSDMLTKMGTAYTTYVERQIMSHATMMASLERIDSYGAAQMHRRWEESMRAEQQLRRRELDLARQYADMFGYQLGTRYVAKTGPALVHRGEEITPATRVGRPQGGSKTSQSFGDINIILPASAAAHRPEDWRYITREFIRPELEKLN